MSAKKKTITQVYELPAEADARTKFLDGVKSLADQCNAVWVAGSVHNEVEYVELLEKELSERIGEVALEDIRQRFEQGSKE